MARIGAHVGGGVKGGVAAALAIQAEALQVFVGSPQMWRAPALKPAEVAAFRAGVADHDLAPVFVHGIYLINLAAERPDILTKSVQGLGLQLAAADELGAKAMIFHPGSAGSAEGHVAMSRVVQALETVLASYLGSAKLAMEVCAGQGQTIGREFDQFRHVIRALGGDERIVVCWDTCHLLAAGYDVATRDGLERTLELFDESVGLPRLVAIHANDSKTPLGSHVDRHANIGEGHIGEAGFELLLNHPQLADQPFILEVPGFEGKGPDLRNIAILRRLAGRPLPEDVDSGEPIRA
ncbi:MAG: deoxyribonuclease IV [Chloroflexi bacterium]|nr:deoxyribonuclease IV [Chloroflexota bacterium]